MYNELVQLFMNKYLKNYGFREANANRVVLSFIVTPTVDPVSYEYRWVQLNRVSSSILNNACV